MANSCLRTLWTCVIFVPNQQSLRLASSSTWSRGFFLIWESTTCAKGQIITLLKIWLTFASLGAFVIFRMCVSEDIFREKSFFTFAASYTHVGSRPLQIQPLTSKLPLSFPIPEGHLSSHTTLREKEDAEEKKWKQLWKKKEMYDCKIMSRISSSLRFIPLFPLWEN